MSEEGPTRNKKMGYFKIPLCRNFVRKVGDYSDRMTRVSGSLGQKLGYDNLLCISKLSNMNMLCLFVIHARGYKGFTPGG